MIIYLAPLFYAYILWLLFLAVMALKAKWAVLPTGVRILAAPAVLVALLMDVIFNRTIACLLFLRLPSKGEWTFSQRVGNYKRRIDWRAPLADWICSNLLDPFEAGGHCKG